MSNIWNIAKKELYRFFTDKRLVFSTVLLPGLMIYIVYSFMGVAFSSMFDMDEIPTAAVVNLPDSVAEIMDSDRVTLLPADSEDQGMSLVKDDDKADVLAVFPADFDEVLGQGGTVPDIHIYYYSSDTASSMAYSTVTGLLDEYENQLTNLFDINRDNPGYDLAEEGNAFTEIFSNMLPFLLIIFLFSGCVSVVPESIAGEKERGTIATLLVTPLHRRDLVIGKVLALGIIAMCSGVSSFIGTYISIPKLGEFSGEVNLSADSLKIPDLTLLLLVIFSTLLLIVSLMAILSAFAKNVKEASTYISPFMIIAMLIGLTAMFGAAPTDLYMYLIPMYNSVQSMGVLLNGGYSVINIVAAILSNFAYASVCVVIVTRMFHSEKILFSR